MTFEIIDLQTGAYPDLRKIAMEEDWAKNLIYCDMEGFHIDENGTLCLVDECGHFVYCPHGRFKVVVKIPNLEHSYVY